MLRSPADPGPQVRIWTTGSKSSACGTGPESPSMRPQAAVPRHGRQDRAAGGWEFLPFSSQSSATLGEGEQQRAIAS
eukprot:1765301-Alexandrium_andersonii.AAC.1